MPCVSIHLSRPVTANSSFFLRMTTHPPPPPGTTIISSILLANHSLKLTDFKPHRQTSNSAQPIPRERIPVAFVDSILFFLFNPIKPRLTERHPPEMANTGEPKLSFARFIRYNAPGTSLVSIRHGSIFLMPYRYRTLFNGTRN